MKHSIIIIIFSYLFYISSNLNAKPVVDSIYQNTMMKTIIELEKAKSVNELQNCKNQFFRLIKSNSEYWMPEYYVAYCNIMSVYANSKADVNPMLLNEANKYMELLESNKVSDKSELEVLKGLYYTAVITLDPETNGRKFYKNATEAYNNALKINAENPRAICLQLFFNQQLPPFLQEKYDVKEELEKARRAFSKEIPNILSPFWGKEYLDHQLKE